MWDDVFVLAEDVEMNRFEDSVMVVCRHDESLHVLNGVAGDILGRLDGQTALADVLRWMSGRYEGVELGTLRTDLAEIMGQMVDKGIVVRVGKEAETRASGSAMGSP